MTNQFYGRTFVVTAALALAACASNPSANSGPPSAATAQANLAMASHEAATSEASSAPLGTPGLKPGNGYRKVTKNGETYFCKKEVITGSRTNTQVNCLTQEEMTALSQQGQDLLNGIRGVPGAQSGPLGPGGGTQPSAVSQ